MIGLQQTLPADFKLSVYAMTSTKNYTLQGWSGGFNLITANISKSLLKDKLNLSLMGMMGLNKGGNINIESHSQGKDFTSHTLTKVPLFSTASPSPSATPSVTPSARLSSTPAAFRTTTSSSRRRAR